MIEALLTYFPYWGIFLLIILGGVGLPLPEDLILILAGHLAHSEDLNVWLMLGVCFLAVWPTDYFLYWVGKKYGRAVWRLRFIRRIMTPKRRVQVMDQFDKHGDKVVFIARFIGGFRAPVFITAGILKMSAIRFLVLDFVASLFSVPLFVFGAYFLGQKLATRATQMAHQITIYLLIFIAIVCVVIFLIDYIKTGKAPDPNTEPPSTGPVA